MRRSASLVLLALALVGAANALTVGDCVANLPLTNTGTAGGSASLGATIALKYLDKTNQIAAFSSIMKSTSPGAATGYVPVTFPAGSTKCSFSAAADIAKQTNVAGAVSAGALDDSGYNIKFANISGSKSAPNGEASFTLSNLAIQMGSATKAQIALGGAGKRLPFSVKVVAGTLDVQFTYKDKTKTSQNVNFTVDMAGKAPKMSPGCMLSLQSTGAFKLACATFPLALGLTSVSGLPNAAVGSVTVTLAPPMGLKMGALAAGTSAIAVYDGTGPNGNSTGTPSNGTTGGNGTSSGNGTNSAIWPTAVADVAVYNATAGLCRTYALRNDQIPDTLATRMYMRCDNSTIELDNPVANLDAAPLNQPGCDQADGASIAFTAMDYQGSEDPLFNGTMWVQEYYFTYTPNATVDPFTASFNYTLSAGGKNSTVTVTCEIPNRNTTSSGASASAGRR